MIVSRKRHGPCDALRWDDDDHRYRCGLLSDPTGTTGLRRPWALRWMKALARRWIAAGQGCDAEPILVRRIDA